MKNIRILFMSCLLAISSLGPGGCTKDCDDDGLGKFYRMLREDALDFAFAEGEWLEDYGDAAAFGPAFYVRAGYDENRNEYLEIARAARDYNAGTIDYASTHPFWYLANAEEVFMAAQG